jgi:hypothetical protein
MWRGAGTRGGGGEGRFIVADPPSARMDRCFRFCDSTKTAMPQNGNSDDTAPKSYTIAV